MLIPENGYNFSSQEIKDVIKFPINLYKKENGFLGLLSVHNDELLFASKSTTEREYVQFFKDIFNKISDNAKQYLFEYIERNNVTLLFEVIDPINDPHIIKYTESSIVLLDIMPNDFKGEPLPYSIVENIAKTIGVKAKELCFTFNNWEELYNFRKLKKESYEDKIEGWVIVDSNNFMLKLKTNYYTFWKYFRGIKNAMCKNHSVKKTFASEHEIRAFKFLESFPKEELEKLNIIQIQDMFYEKYKDIYENKNEFCKQ